METGAVPEIQEKEELGFSSFDLKKLLRQGSSLLAREGSELEVDRTPELGRSEKLAKQRRQIDQVRKSAWS
jgi:hypothetical protein